MWPFSCGFVVSDTDRDCSSIASVRHGLKEKHDGLSLVVLDSDLCRTWQCSQTDPSLSEGHRHGKSSRLLPLIAGRLRHLPWRHGATSDLRPTATGLAAERVQIPKSAFSLLQKCICCWDISATAEMKCFHEAGLTQANVTASKRVSGKKTARIWMNHLHSSLFCVIRILFW